MALIFRKRLLMRLILFMMIFAGTIGQITTRTTLAQTDTESTWTENFIYVLEDGWNRETEYQSLLADIGIGTGQVHGPQAERLVREYPYALNGVWLRLSPEENTAAQREARGRPGVLYAGTGFDVNLEPEGMIGEPYSGPQITPTGFTRIEAYEGNFERADVLVAIMDTGVDAQHPDLNVVDGYDCSREGLLGEREIDAWARDLYGHGTHVDGTATARDNPDDEAGYVRGTAAGMPSASIAILGDDGSGSMASLLCGADVLAEWKITGKYDRIVANWSVGGNNPASTCDSWDALHLAFCNTTAMGIVHVVSAGNDGFNAIGKSPANYPEAVTVSALTDYDGLPGGLSSPPEGIPVSYRDDWRALFSNFGEAVDFIAPGVNILSTLPGSTVGYAHGTSMATPHVTGVLAGWWAMNPLANGLEVVEANLYWADLPGWQVRSGWDAYLGPTNEVLIRGGAPSWTSLVDDELVEEIPLEGEE